MLINFFGRMIDTHHQGKLNMAVMTSRQNKVAPVTAFIDDTVTVKPRKAEQILGGN